MNRFLAGGLAASLLAYATQIHAQSDPRKTTEAWMQRGQQEMAPTWQKLGQTHKAAVFRHKEIRKADNGRVAVWTHSELPDVAYLEKEKPYLSTRELMLVDCKSVRLGMSEQTFYAEHFARGVIVGTNRFKNADMLEAVPDSVEDTLVKIVCAPKPRKAAVRKPIAPKAQAADGSATKDTPAKDVPITSAPAQTKTPETSSPKAATPKDAMIKAAPKTGSAETGTKDVQPKDPASRPKAAGAKTGT